MFSAHVLGSTPDTFLPLFTEASFHVKVDLLRAFGTRGLHLESGHFFSARYAAATGSVDVGTEEYTVFGFSGDRQWIQVHASVCGRSAMNSHISYVKVDSGS